MRIGMKLLSDGSFSDDQYVIEYLGGILASSRSAQDRDDRGIVWSSLVSTMSSYAVMVHYIVYHEITRLLRHSTVNPKIEKDLWERGQVWMPWDLLCEALDFTDDEDSDGALSHSLIQLSRNGLVQVGWASGEPAGVRQFYPNLPVERLERHGVLLALAPAIAGLELYLWAHGLGKEPVDLSFRTEFAFEGVHIPSGSRLVGVKLIRSRDQDFANSPVRDERQPSGGSQMMSPPRSAPAGAGVSNYSIGGEGRARSDTEPAGYSSVAASSSPKLRRTGIGAGFLGTRLGLGSRDLDFLAHEAEQLGSRVAKKELERINRSGRTRAVVGS